MKKLTSGPSFFRRQLKIKGKTWHNGRGMYHMQFDCSVEELTKRVEEMIQRKGDMFVVDRKGASVSVRVKDEYIAGTELSDRSYFTLVMIPKSFESGLLLCVC